MAKTQYGTSEDESVKVEFEQVKKDTTITTADGDVLVQKGNYIVTHVDELRKGKQFAITPDDFNRRYKPVK